MDWSGYLILAVILLLGPVYHVVNYARLSRKAEAVLSTYVDLFNACVEQFSRLEPYQQNDVKLQLQQTLQAIWMQYPSSENMRDVIDSFLYDAPDEKLLHLYARARAEYLEEREPFKLALAIFGLTCAAQALARRYTYAPLGKYLSTHRMFTLTMELSESFDVAVLRLRFPSAQERKKPPLWPVYRD